MAKCASVKKRNENKTDGKNCAQNVANCRKKWQELRAEHGENCRQSVSPCASFQSFILISYLFCFFVLFCFVFVLFNFVFISFSFRFVRFGGFSRFSWFSQFSRFEDVLISFRYPTWMREHILELH